MTFSIEKIAREYVQRRFPNASVLEKEKVVGDWINKIPDSQALVLDFKRRVGEPKDKKIIDVGCGNGGVSIAFALAGAEVSGIDIENNLYEIAKLHAKAYDVSAKFFLYDGLILPFGDNFFDHAISVSVLEHTTDPIKYLSEILRVIKPNGKLYLAFPNKFWFKETHAGLWFLTYLPSFLRPTYIKLFHRNPLEENNLHFYSYSNLQKLLKNISDDRYKWEIITEKGQSENKIKILIKKIIELFGLPYKMFLSHISLILKKVE